MRNYQGAADIDLPSVGHPQRPIGNWNGLPSGVITSEIVAS